MAFTPPKPVNFAAVITRRPGDDTPTPLLRRAARRRVAELREAASVLTVLPGPGEQLHALQSGRYDLTRVVEVLLNRFGPARLVCATLAFSQGNTVDLLVWLQSGKLLGLDLLCSLFFRNHNGELFRSFRADLRERGARLAATRNHCKVVCLAFASGERLVIEGSANLRTNSNQEQFALIHDAALHDWHTAWITSRIDQHEGDKDHGAT